MKSLLLTLFLVVTCCVSTAQILEVIEPDHSMGKYEDEFLYWCMPDGDGVWAVYDRRPTACREDKISRGQWAHKRMPLSVNSSAELMSETMDAIDAFNASVGIRLFRYEHANLDPDVAVFDNGEHVYAAAEANMITLNGKHYGVVKTYNGLHDKDRADIIFHELGHILGLSHDHDNKMSIMYPSSATRVASLEQQDIDAIRALYARAYISSL